MLANDLQLGVTDLPASKLEHNYSTDSPFVEIEEPGLARVAVYKKPWVCACLSKARHLPRQDLSRLYVGLGLSHPGLFQMPLLTDYPMPKEHKRWHNPFGGHVAGRAFLHPYRGRALTVLCDVATAFSSRGRGGKRF